MVTSTAGTEIKIRHEITNLVSREHFDLLQKQHPQCSVLIETLAGMFLSISEQRLSVLAVFFAMYKKMQRSKLDSLLAPFWFIAEGGAIQQLRIQQEMQVDLTALTENDLELINFRLKSLGLCFAVTPLGALLYKLGEHPPELDIVPDVPSAIALVGAIDIQVASPESGAINLINSYAEKLAGRYFSND